ncbi:hypothetical protein [Sediminitomix flava]|uniref:Uncharacterized protein n=1 Tax=Sediminitomix flava TaxID=379075 RepID=A0A315YT40_SEDFL|nr:hypothetical protein [Sediminitomix flava]PWJ31714.1 hypothetical protein BC781_1232 [Sediminitomix flava]
MKLTFLIAIMFSTLNCLGQACGRYTVKYVGEINLAGDSRIQISLPSIRYLHGFGKKGEANEFIRADIKNGKIELETYSSLTSHLYSDSESYLELYKKHRKDLPIKIESEKGKVKILHIPWDLIRIYDIKKNELGNLIIGIDLNKIEL